MKSGVGILARRTGKSRGNLAKKGAGWGRKGTRREEVDGGRGEINGVGEKWGEMAEGKKRSEENKRGEQWMKEKSKEQEENEDGCRSGNGGRC